MKRSQKLLVWSFSFLAAAAAIMGLDTPQHPSVVSLPEILAAFLFIAAAVFFLIWAMLLEEVGK